MMSEYGEGTRMPSRGGNRGQEGYRRRGGSGRGGRGFHQQDQNSLQNRGGFFNDEAYAYSQSQNASYNRSPNDPYESHEHLQLSQKKSSELPPENTLYPRRSYDRPQEKPYDQVQERPYDRPHNTQHQHHLPYNNLQPQVRNLQKESFQVLSSNLQLQMQQNRGVGGDGERRFVTNNNKNPPLLPDPPGGSMFQHQQPPPMNSGINQQNQNQHRKNYIQQSQDRNGQQLIIGNGVPIRSVYETFNTGRTAPPPPPMPNAVPKPSIGQHIHNQQNRGASTPQPRSQSEEVKLGQRSFPGTHNPNQVQNPEKSPCGNMAFLAKMSADDLLKNFRSLECAGCQRHFGYQCRARKEIVFCTASCMEDHSGCISLPTVPETQLLRSQAPAQASFPLSQQTQTNLRKELPPRNGGGKIIDSNQNSPTAPSGGYGSMAMGSSNSAFTKAPGHTGNGYRERGPAGPRPYTTGNRERSAPSAFGRKAGASGGIPFTKYGDDESEWGGEDSSRPDTDVVDRTPQAKQKDANAPPHQPELPNQTENTPKPVTLPSLDTKSVQSPSPAAANLKPQQKFPPRKPPPLGGSISSLQEPSKKFKVGSDPLLSVLGNLLKWKELELCVALSVSRTVVNDLGDFFIHTFETHKAAVDMVDKIYEIVSSGSISKLDSYAEKTLCLAPFDGDYYRGEIVKLAAKGDKAVVFFCDYGNVESVMVEDLMELPKELLAIPRLAIHCRWNLVLSGENPVGKLRTWFAEEKLPIKPTHKVANGQYIVQLGEYESRATFDIIHTIEHELSAGSSVSGASSVAPNSSALTTSSASAPSSLSSAPAPSPALQVPSPAPTTAAVPLATPSPGLQIPSPAPTTPAVPLATPPPVAAGAPVASKFTGLRPQIVRAQPAAAAPTRNKYMLKDLQHSSFINPQAEVLISFTWSPDRHLVVGDDHEVEAPKLQSLIQQNIGACETLNGDAPVLGEVLLGAYEGDEYYRGVVKSVDMDKKTAILEFVDYGDKSVNKFDQLRIPSSDMMKVPIMGLNVTLPKLASVSDELPKGVLSDFANEKMQVQFLDEPIHDGVDVALWISDTVTLNAIIHKTPISMA